MNKKSKSNGLETLTRQCSACRNVLSLVDSFNRCSGHNRSAGWKTTCKDCEIEGKIRTKRKSALQRAISQQLINSHQRMLDQALNETPEITDLNELRNKYPGYDFTRLKKLQALNIKINAANDFLIEEQSAWLDPSSRPAGGIEYHAELFEERVFEDDKELSTIISQQVDIDDK
jgi:hypothetical protein